VFSSKVKVSFDGGRVQAMLNSTEGPVGKEMMKRARLTAAMSRAQAPMGTGPRAGRLKRSIRVYQHRRYVMGQGLKVGTSVPYAIYVHEGTRPHTIRPKNPGGALVFAPKGGTRVVITRKVNHPGSRPNRFLADNVKYMYIP
jgi:hypothetical protein